MDTFVDNVDDLNCKEQTIDALLDQLCRKENTIAWETDRGIGIISSVSQCVNRKEKELEEAKAYVRYVSVYHPDLQIRIGTADYSDGWANFAKRLKNAETSTRIGRQIWPNNQIYHYEDCGFYQVLAPFAVSSDSLAYISKTIGPLIELDQKNGGDLVETLERILSGLSFKEIGAQMYLHHKTIQLRKQRIEQILNISLDSFETRMTLATALQLMKISDKV